MQQPQNENPPTVYLVAVRRHYCANGNINTDIFYLWGMPHRRVSNITALHENEGSWCHLPYFEAMHKYMRRGQGSRTLSGDRQRVTVLICNVIRSSRE